MYELTDNTGTVWLINYVVTQFPWEGPEYWEYRLKDADSSFGWTRLPIWAQPPEEVIEHFHGEMSRLEAPQDLMLRDLNDALGALFRLGHDLKRAGVPDEVLKLNDPDLMPLIELVESITGCSFRDKPSWIDL